MQKAAVLSGFILIAGIVLMTVVICFSTGCNNKKPDQQFGHARISTGKTTRLVNQVVSAGGGTVTVNKPGDPMNGLSIEVPPGAYTGEHPFEISSAPLTNYDCGPDFHPLTPLISISNGGGYAREAMTLTIPVQIPEGQFAMAFIYDEEKHELEGMLLLASGNNEVVVATTNFSPASRHSGHYGSSVAAGVSGIMDNDEDVEKIIITSASESTLLGDYESGFKPGTDDCPFANYGSCYAPSGECNGQSLTEIWYYSEKKSHGSPPLYQVLDNDGENITPGIWQDDANGIKLASVMQYDYSAFSVLFRGVVGALSLGVQTAFADDVTMNAFRYALKLTKQPQLVCIAIPGLTMQRHAMVLYKIQGNLLYVADPNFPGDSKRRIVYDEVQKAFLPYVSGENANALGSSYPSIFYMPKSANPSWPTAKTNWEKFESKTIGQGKFPDYSIVALNEQDEFVPLEDGFKVPGTGRLTLSVRSEGNKLGLLFFDAQGKGMLNEDNSLQLQNGTQRLGIEVTKNGMWAGFTWVTVTAEGYEPNVGGLTMNGKLSLHLDIDGENKTIDSATFTYDDVYGLSIQAWSPRLPEGIYAFDYTLNLHVRGLNGPGIYTPDEGGSSSYLWQYHSYPLDKENSGRVTITHWAENGFDGQFSFTVKDDSGNRKTLTGDFHYSK